LGGLITRHFACYTGTTGQFCHGIPFFTLV
jgi:hypothetical protein